MRHLLEDWSNLAPRFREAQRALLLFDYDGTLTPIVSQPDLAVLSPEVRRRLQDLGNHPRYLVGVISGRSLSDVREKVGLTEIAYAGNHGLEMEGPGLHFRHPAARQVRPVLDRVYRDLCRQLANYPGVLVEDKGLTLSVHYRMVPEAQEARVESKFQDTVSDCPEKAMLRITRGKKVLEVRPNVDWNKGNAIARLMEAHPEASLVCFFGDDVTDEDGFAVVRDSARGIAVRVGLEEAETRAEYRVDSPQQVSRFLFLAAQA
jgi:trehalose 6-phosphate phosphatase